MQVSRSWLVLAGAFAALSLSAAAQAPVLPPPPSATAVTASGKTATTVSQVAGATQVSTSTVSGGNAYNDFSAFQVASGSTVNLLVPSAATNNNLLNLVSGGTPTQIYGTVNSLLNDGSIGGNIYFADPQGIIIGAGGILNVGSLTLATPTSDFVNNFFSDLATNTSTLLAGTEPLDPNGLIAVAGQINSVGPTTLNSTTAYVSGGISTGAAQFTSLVNTAGLQTGQSISINGNTILIDGGASPATLNAGSGDVDLTANPSDSEAVASAIASITLGNASLSGNNINLKATATATSKDSFGSEVTNFSDLTSFPFNVAGIANINSATTSATINVGGGAGATTLNATGNVTIAAEADPTVNVITLAPIGDFSYGSSSGTAVANLAANATITAGGTATLSTLVNNNLYLNPSAVGTGTPSASVSYGSASSASTTTLAGTVTAANIGVTADNENSFSTGAGAAAADNGIAGIGVALAFYTSQANAVLSGTATATGADATANGSTTSALNLLATSNNNTDNTSSASSVSDDTSVSTVTQSATGGLAFVGDLGDFLKNKLGSSDENSESDPSPLALSAAVSYASDSNAATATVTGAATAQAGSANIASSAQDTPQINANGTAGGAKASLGGGVAISNFSNTATTTVSGTVGGNQGVTIASTAALPDPFNLNAFTSLPGEFSNLSGQWQTPSSITDGSAFSQDWNAAETLGGDLVNILNPNNSNGIGQFVNANLGLNNVVTTFVNTGASAEGGKGGGSGFGIAGSVNIMGLTNQATTTVASGAKVDAANNGVNVAAEGDAYLINIVGMAADLGQLKDKNPGAKGDGALGGSYDGITLNNGATAAVNDGALITTENSGDVNVNGTTNETLINIGQAGDNAGKFGVNGTFNWFTLVNNALAYIQSNATVNSAGNVGVNASNNLTDFTIGGALGYGGNAQVGATVDWNQFTDNTEAYIGDPNDSRTSATGSVTAAGNVTVQATANESLWNISLAAELATGQSQNDDGNADTSEGGGTTATSEGTGSGGDGGGDEGFGLGISGNVALNDITDFTAAFINNAAQVLAANQISLNASDTSWAVSAGLAAALASGGESGVDLAGAFARNDFSKDTQATADNALLAGPLVQGLPSNAASIGLEADNSGELLTISAGGGISTGEGVSLAGSANNNVLSNLTLAGFGTGAVANASGNISVNAIEADKVLSIAGALAYSGSAGIGAGLDLSTYTNTTDAVIANGAQVNAGGNLSVTASTDEKLLPIAAALGLSSDVGLGGSVVKDEITNDTEATIGDAQVSAGENLLLGADDPSQLLLIAGSLGGAGDAGVGVAGAISIPGQPLLSRTVKATIATGATVSAPGNSGTPIDYMGQAVDGMLLDATAEGNADTIAAGVGVAGDAGIAASLVLNYFNEDVEANIAAGASINPGDSFTNHGQQVTLNANDNTQILDVAGEIAGAGTAAIGASADVQTLTRTVQASLGGAVNAGGNIAATATLGGTDWSVAGAASLAGTADLAGAASAIFDTSTITAAIAPNATVYTPGSVLVDAEHSNTLNTIDGELGFSAEVGIGGAVSLVEQQDTTTADVGQSATVTALGDGAGVLAWVNSGNQAQQATVNGLAVVANANDTLLTIAAGGQITTGVSVAGSVVLNNISDTTQAYVDQDAVLNPASTQNLASGRQSVDILANDGTTLTAGAGSLAAGIDIYGVGIGAAVNLEGPLSQLPSAASGFSSSLNAALDGTSDPNAPSPSGFSKLTTAGVNNGASVNALGGLAISALSSETLTNYLGSVAAGIVGVAGTVELDDYTPITTAYFGDCASSFSCSSTTGATANVGSAAIAANDNFQYSAVVGEASLGGVGLGAAVLDSTVAAQTSAFVGAFSSLTANKGVGINSNFQDTYDAAVLAGGVAAIAVNVPYATITDSSTNAAAIANASTVSGGDGAVSIQAGNQRTIASVVAGAELSALGASAEIDNVTFQGGNSAGIGLGDNVTSNAAISLGANLADSVPEYLPADFARIPSISADSIPTGVLGAAIGALAGTGGQITLTDNGNDTAAIGDSTVTAGQGMLISANNDPSLYAASAGLDGGLLGAGASISDINLGGKTAVNLNGTLTATHGQINATSQLVENLTATATGIGGGLADGNGTVTNINDNSTNNLTQSGSLTSDGGLSLEANTTRVASATSGSTSYGLLAVGISFADLNLNGTTAATISGAVDAGAGPATVQAYDNDSATADAVVNAAGAANGIGAMAGTPDGFSADPSLVDPHVNATVASTGSVNAGELNIFDTDYSNLSSTANGGAAGAVNVGLLDAEGHAVPNLQLEVDGSLTGGNITLRNTSNQSVTSDAQSSESSSVLSGYSTTDGASALPFIRLFLDGSATASGDLLIESDSTNSVSATATAVASEDIDGFNFNLLAGGYTTSTADINNFNSIYLYGTAASSNGNASFNAISSNTIATNSATGGTGSGVATGADTTANTFLTDSTHANLVGTLSAVNGTATQLAQGSEEALSNASDDTSGASGLSYIESNSFTSIDADIVDNVDATAVVNANLFNLTATMPSLFAGSSATGIAEPGLHGDGDANSTLNLTLDPTVHVLGGAVLTAPTINILANDGGANPFDGNIFAGADPTAGTHSASGSATADDTLNASVNPTVTLDSGSILNTNNLSIQALYPLNLKIGAGPQVNGVSAVTYVTEQVEETVDEVVGWIPIIGDLVKAVTKWVTETIEEITDSTVTINNFGSRLTDGSNINLNSTINQLNGVGAANLTIGANGQVEPGSNGLSVQNEDSGNVVINSLVNNATGLSLTLIAEGGTIAGSPTIVVQNMPATVDITNDSNLNLVMQQLSPIGNGNGELPFTLEADNNNLTPNFVDNETPTAITITNNGTGAVVFTHQIQDAPGSLNVVNQGGSILGGLSALLDVNQLSLDAPHGSIGSAAGSSLSCAICPGAASGSLLLGPLNIQPDEVALTQNSAPIVPTVAAVAKGDIDLNVTPFESVPGDVITGAPSVNLTNLLAGGNVNLDLNPAQVQGVELETFTVDIPVIGEISFQEPVPVNGPAASTVYNVGAGQWLAAGGNLNITANGASGNQVTLNDNGLVASGFQNIQFNLDPHANPASLVTADGQNNASLIDYLQNFGGAPVLDNLNLSSGGHIAITGDNGAVTGNGTLGVLEGFSGLQVGNAGPAGLTVENVSDNGVPNSSISVFGANQPLTGTLAGSSVALARYGNGAGSINLNSNSSLDLVGTLMVPVGSVNLNAMQSLDTSQGLIFAGSLANLNTPGNASLGRIQVLSGDVDANVGGSLTDSFFITASGNVNLTAQQNLILDQITAGGDANLTAQAQSLELSSLDAGGNANLRSGGSMVVGTLGSGGNAGLNAGASINARTVVAGGSATLDAGLDLDLGTVAAKGGNATLTSIAGGINAPNGQISASQDALLTAARDIDLGTVTAGGAANLRSNLGNINLGSVTAGADATLWAAFDINAPTGNVSAGQDATLTAGQNIALGTVTAANDATLAAIQNISLGSVTAGADATIGTVVGDINFGAVSPGPINRAVTAGADANLQAGGSINGANGAISAQQDASLTALNGSISVGAVNAGGNATLTAQQDINLGQVVAQNGNATLQATLGNINFGAVNPGPTQAGADLNLTAGSSINAANAVFIAGNDATLSALTGGIDLGLLTAANNATLTAAQDISLGTLAAGVNATLTAGGSINLVSITAGNNASLTAGGDVTDGTGITAGVNATVTAGGNIALDFVQAGDNATLTAGNNATLGAVTATAGNAAITATAGDINLGAVTAGVDAILLAGHDINAVGGSITAGRDASLTAGHDINLGAVNAGRNISITAGDDLNGLAAVLTAANNLTIAVGNDLSLGAATAGHDAALTAGHDINLGTVAAGNNASLTASDDINVAATGSVTAGATATLTTLVNDINLLGNVTAPTAILTANRNISGGGTVLANITQLAAETGAIGTSGDAINLELNTIGGLTPTLTAVSRGDSNLNLTAVNPDGSLAASTDEPVGKDPTLYADINGLMVGGNLNLNLNPGVQSLATGATGAINAWYEIPGHEVAIAAGSVNVNEAAPGRDYDAVTLDVDGLLASGFQGLKYVVDANGNWTTTVYADGQSITGLMNLATIAGGVINLSDINAAQGGQINVTGSGQLANPSHLFALDGPSTVAIINQDPNLVLETNNIALGYVRGDVDIAGPSRTGGIVIDRADDFADGGFGPGFGNGWFGWPGNDGGHDGHDDDSLPTLAIYSADSINLNGAINNLHGATRIAAQGDITGGGLTGSQVLDLASLQGSIGAPGSPLAVAVGGVLNAFAQGNVVLTSPAGDLPVGWIHAGGDINLSTPDGSIINAFDGWDGWDGDGSWKHDDDPPASNLTGNNITLSASGVIGGWSALTGAASGQWNVSAGQGVNLVSNGNFNAASVATAAGALQLTVNGNASIAQLSAPSAAVSLTPAGASLDVTQASIASSLDVDADNILISLLTHTGAVNPLDLSLQGRHDGIAQTVDANVVSSSPVQLDYASQTGAVNVTGAWLDVDNAIIGQSATFANSWLQVAVTDVDKHGRPQSLNLDMVGNRESSQGNDLATSVTALPAGAFTLPGTLTPAEQAMVRELGHGH